MVFYSAPDCITRGAYEPAQQPQQRLEPFAEEVPDGGELGEDHPEDGDPEIGEEIHEERPVERDLARVGAADGGEHGVCGPSA